MVDYQDVHRQAAPAGTGGGRCMVYKVRKPFKDQVAGADESARDYGSDLPVGYYVCDEVSETHLAEFGIDNYDLALAFMQGYDSFGQDE